MRPKSSTWQPAERTHAHSAHTTAQHYTFPLLVTYPAQESESLYPHQATAKPDASATAPTTTCDASDTPYARSTQDPLTAQLAWLPSQSGVALTGPTEVMGIPPPVPGLHACRHKG